MLNAHIFIDVPLALFARVLCALLLIGLVACGGGGGGDTNEAPTDPTPTDPPPTDPTPTDPAPTDPTPTDPTPTDPPPTDPPPTDPATYDPCTDNPSPAWCAGSYAVADIGARTAAFASPDSPTVTIVADPADFAATVLTYETAEYDKRYTILVKDENRLIIDRLHFDNPRLGRIKAAYAYSRGATGKDVTITIVDSGINANHREFAGEGKLTVRNLYGDYTTKVTDEFYGYLLQHGTAVAAIAAGVRHGDEEMHGVAFDATIDFIPYDLSARPSSEPEPTDLERAVGYDFLIKAAKGDILNFSWGVSQNIADVLRSDMRDKWARTAAAFAQGDTPDADKKIIVWAAGNFGKASPDRLAALGVDFPELQSHTIVVIGLEVDGVAYGENFDARERGQSNYCGLAKNFCIAAPGWRIKTAFHNLYNPTADNQYREQSGTSFAAPMVSGALAVMKQFFRNQLGNTELVERLFATADRSDYSASGGADYSNADIYGQGVVDLDNATKPQGMVTTGMPGDKDSMPLSQTGFTLTGNAFGASFAELSNIEIAGFDELGAPFFMPASLLIAHTASDKTPPPTKLTAQLPDGELALRVGADNLTQSGYVQQGGWVLGYGENPAQFFGNARMRDNVNDAFNFADNDHRFNHINIGFDNNNAFVSPYLSLAQNGTSAGWRNDNGRFGFAFMQGNAHFDQWQDNGGERGLGLLMDWTTHTKHGAIALQAGAVRETDSLLGACANQSDLSAQTLFAGINIAHRFGDWQTLASAYFGNTEPTARNAYWQLDDTIKSGAFAFAASRQSWQSQHDQLTIRLTQPLRTERAQATLNMPAGRTKYGEVIHQQHNIDLSPNGRTLQLEAAYQTPVAIKSKSDSTVQTAIGVERHPMHDAARDSRWYVRLGVETRF